jgi:ribosomal protein S18 acetylase RimI-like enzyme
MVCSTLISIERINTMNNHSEQNNGFFTAQDKHGNAVIIEWHKTNILSPELAAFKKEVSNLASTVTAATETQFLQKHPEAISSGGFLRNCEPLFVQGVQMVDWTKVEQTLQASIAQFYLADISKFGAKIINMLINDVYYFASIKDQETDQILGFLMAAITPALPQGTLKLINLVVAPEHQNRDLEKLLLSSIIKAFPDVTRIFTTIRTTDQNALMVFESCGFEEDKEPVQDPLHPIDERYLLVLDYRMDRSDILQKTAQQLSE